MVRGLLRYESPQQGRNGFIARSGPITGLQSPADVGYLAFND
jgi:hypothetical protein